MPRAIGTRAQLKVGKLLAAVSGAVGVEVVALGLRTCSWRKPGEPMDLARTEQRVVKMCLVVLSPRCSLQSGGGEIATG
jgi:hypothetical protein